MNIREKLYSLGLFRKHNLPVPIISIGNLVLGGTGKTPTVLNVAKLLIEQGFKPAIISRGYGGSASGAINIVSDGINILLTPNSSGDEPYMLAQQLPGVPVLTGKKRYLPCRHAIEKFGATALIMDDGFQHLSVNRDINLVLFDATTLAGNSRIFPGGPLREPTSALLRCDGFVITGRSDANRERSERFSQLLKKRYPEKPVFFTSLDNYRLVDKNTNIVKNGPNDSFYVFCGIANPERFQKSVQHCKYPICAFQTFDDHAHYNQAMLTDLNKRAIDQGATALVTTSKDYVKLARFNSQLPLYSLIVDQLLDDSFRLFLHSRLTGLTGEKTNDSNYNSPISV